MCVLLWRWLGGWPAGRPLPASHWPGAGGLHPGWFAVQWVVEEQRAWELAGCSALVARSRLGSRPPSSRAGLRAVPQRSSWPHQFTSFCCAALQAIDAELDLTDKGLGVRSRRYAMLADDGVVKVRGRRRGDVALCALLGAGPEGRVSVSRVRGGASRMGWMAWAGGRGRAHLGAGCATLGGGGPKNFCTRRRGGGRRPPAGRRPCAGQQRAQAHQFSPAPLSPPPTPLPQILNLEEGGAFTVSSAEEILAAL